MTYQRRDCVPADLNNLWTVIRDMRDVDWREVQNASGVRDRAAYHERLSHLPLGLSFAFRMDRHPVAIFGAVEDRPGVWTAYGFGTPELPAVASGVTRFARRYMVPMLYRAGAHRVHALSSAEHRQAHRWLHKGLGATCEGRMVGYGANGMDFLIFAVNRDTLRKLGGRALNGGG